MSRRIHSHNGFAEHDVAVAVSPNERRIDAMQREIETIERIKLMHQDALRLMGKYRRMHKHFGEESPIGVVCENRMLELDTIIEECKEYMGNIAN